MFCEEQSCGYCLCTLDNRRRHEGAGRGVATIRASRRIERAGVNAVRRLFDDHDLLLQEIDGGADHGEDMLVQLSRNGRPSGHWFAVQIKSGRKYQRANGFAIPVDDHHDGWRNSRIPVIGIVYDLDGDGLYWTNLTRELRKASEPQSWVQISGDNILSDDTIHGFAADIEHYIDTAGMRRAGREAVLGRDTTAFQPSAPQPGQGLEGGPNMMFAGMASMLLRLPWLMRYGRRILWISILAMIMVADWPYMNEFVTRYDPKYGSGMWVTNIYMFLGFLLMVFLYELKAGRFAVNTYRWLGFFYFNFLWLPMIMGDGKRDHWWGEMWITIGAVAPNIGEVMAIGFFIRQELDRHRAASQQG